MDKQIVKKIANLARLELTEQEEELYSSQLETVLNYFEVLNEANTDGISVEKTRDQASAVQMREDKDEGLNRKFNKEILFENIPEMEGGFIKVKEVFKKSYKAIKL